MIHLIVGNTGSGKTTYAQTIKKENGGLLFSIDTWNKILFLPDKKDKDGLNWMLERIDRSEEMIMKIIDQLEASSVDSILDLGLSKFQHREKFRKFAALNGYEIKIHFLDVNKEIRWNRIQNRNIEKGSTYEFQVTRENFDFMEAWFEKPEPGEMKDGVIKSNI